jgi:hypothetical protein
MSFETQRTRRHIPEDDTLQPEFDFPLEALGIFHFSTMHGMAVGPCQTFMQCTLPRNKVCHNDVIL